MTKKQYININERSVAKMKTKSKCGKTMRDKTRPISR